MIPRPRYTSDYRTLFWALVLFPLVPLFGYARPSALGWLLPLLFYLAYSSGVLAHNQVHVPVFSARWANGAYAMWLSIFYGCPIAFWIPTHLADHHRFLDGEQDATRTTRRSTSNGLWQALVYSLACAQWQRPLISAYVREAYARRAQRWRALRNQAAAVVLAHAALLTLAVCLHGTSTGLFTYTLCFGLPALLASPFMQFTNYIQHVHCDPLSPDDHSRNFTSPLANWFVFDAGYHTVHHERPNVHWSRYAELHRQRSAAIHPGLVEQSVLSFCVKRYVLGAVSERFRTQPLRTQLAATPLALHVSARRQ